MRLQAAAKGFQIGRNLVFIRIAHVGVEIQPCEEVRRALHKVRAEFLAREFLSADIVRQNRLPRFTRKNDYRELAWADTLAVSQYFEFLKVFDVDGMPLHVAACYLAVQPFLKFCPFRPQAPGLCRHS